MKLAKNISIFTFFNLLNASIPFLLLPVLTIYLSPTDYGILDIFNSLAMLFTPIVGLSIIESINRYYFEKEKIDLPGFVNTVFKSLLRYGLIFISAISILSIIIYVFFSDNYDFPLIVLILAAVYVFGSQIGEVVLIIWRVSYKTTKYGLFRTFKTICDLGFSILLIIVFDMKWEGRIGPQVVITVLFGIISYRILTKMGLVGSDLGFDKNYNKKALSYSFPLVFHSLGGYVISVSDRFFVLFIEGVEATGIYGVAYQIGMAVGLFQNSFNQAWVPFFFENLKKGTIVIKKKLVKITYLYFLLLALIVAFFTALTPYIYKYFVGNEFQSGIKVVFWVLLGYGFNGMYKMVVNYLFYLKLTKNIATFTLLAACLNLILNYFLIINNGLIGAAQATAISFLFLFIMVFIKATAEFKIPWTLK